MLLLHSLLPTVQSVCNSLTANISSFFQASLLQETLVPRGDSKPDQIKRIQPQRYPDPTHKSALNVHHSDLQACWIGLLQAGDLLAVVSSCRAAD